MLVSKIHTYSTALFTVYGTLHVLHHFLAATIYSPDWHMEIQNKYMPRGFVGEKLLVWLPMILSYVSGWMLLYKNKSQMIRAVKETVQIVMNWCNLSTSSSSRTTTATTSSSSSSSSFAALRRIQYMSALLLGICLSAHLPAVFTLRFIFKGRNHAPVNIYTACHEMHNSKMPALIRYIFVAYYGFFVASFFVHAFCGLALYLIKKANREDKSSAAVAEADTAVENQSKKNEDWYYKNLVVPCMFVSTVLGFVTSVGLYLKTSEEACAAHFPKF